MSLFRLDALSVAPNVAGETRTRANVFVADTFYAQSDYDEASAGYSAVEVNPEWPDAFANHVRTRTIDSLSAVGKPDQAVSYAVDTIRHHHREFESSHAALLRAKAIYLLAVQGRLSEAVPLAIPRRPKPASYATGPCLLYFGWWVSLNSKTCQEMQFGIVETVEKGQVGIGKPGQLPPGSLCSSHRVRNPRQAGVRVCTSSWAAL
jgi:hypothetical protein